MAIVGGRSRAAVFFMLGALVTCAIVATTRYADAQFGFRRPMAGTTIAWSFKRAEIPGTSVGVVAAKCLTTESVVSGGYSLVNVGDGTKVHVFQSYPDHFENAYVVQIRNDFSSPIVAYSYVGCQPR